MIGRRLDRYEILSSLGQGGMGSVWRARDLRLEREVALKIVAPALAGSQDARRRLLREARTASRLEHPSIARVLDAGEADGDVYVVFELIDGSTVKDRCDEGPIPLDDVVRWGRQAAEALDYAHRQGVIHRDITARNVMVDGQGRAVLVDFGLAITDDGSRWTRASAPMGTAAYVAPEVAGGNPADRRSDVYSLCVVLYEALTGRLPFQGERMEAILYAIVHTEPPLASTHRGEIPPRLDSLLAAGMEKDPDRRIHSAAALADALADDAFLEERAGVGRSLSSLVRSRGRRRPKAAVVGLAIVAVVAMAILAWWYRSHSGLGSMEPGQRRIAVVSLHDSGRGSDGVTIGEGVWASIQSKLTRNSPLDVTPWETSRRLAATDLGIVELAARLNRDALVVGQLIEAAGRLRGTVSILRGSDARPLWSRDFDRPVAELIDLEAELATDVAAQLVGRLSDAQREAFDQPLARNPEAFRFYVDGASALQSETRAAARKADELFQRALDEDPTFAPAHVGLGAIRAQRFWFNWAGGVENLRAARRRYERAVELDPGLVEARRGLITIAWYLGDTERCLQQGELVAATGRTDAEALFVQAVAYMMGGLPSRSIPLFDRVLELDPDHEGASWYVVPALSWAERHEEAVDAAGRYLHVFGENPEVRLHMGAAYDGDGHHRVALAAYERARELYGDSPNIVVLYALAFTYRRLGMEEEFRRTNQGNIEFLEGRLRAFGENTQLYGPLALAYALAGETMKAEELIEKATQAPRTSTGSFEIMWAYLELGRGEEARDWLRSLWEAGYFNAADFYYFRTDSPDYIPELVPLLPEARSIHRRLLERYEFGLPKTRAPIESR